jgi:hypothetical protein
MFPQKLSDVSFTNSKQIQGRPAIAKPLISEYNALMRKRWCHDHKTWTSGMKHKHDMVRWVIPFAVPYIRKSLCLENTQGSLQSRMPGSTSQTWEVL